MKLQTPNPVVASVRCAHRSAGGRRCRLSVSDPRSVFCPQHRSEQLEEEAADHYPYLSNEFQDFQTAQGINYSLRNLYQLLAQNRISPRRAAVLSHICGLLLRTLPQIDADQAAGIIDPTKPTPITIPVADQVIDSGADSKLDPAPEPHAASSTPPHKPRASDSANSWDPTIPEPDPRKKPS